MLTPDNPQHLNIWLAAKQANPLGRTQIEVLESLLQDRNTDPVDYEAVRSDIAKLAALENNGAFATLQMVLAKINDYRVPLTSLQNPLCIGARDALLNTVSKNEKSLDAIGAQVILYGSTLTDLPEKGDVDLVIIYRKEHDEWDLARKLARAANKKIDEEDVISIERSSFEELFPETPLRGESLRVYRQKINAVLSNLEVLLTGVQVFPLDSSDFTKLQEDVLSFIQSNPLLTAFSTLEMQSNLARIEERARLADRFIEE